MKTLQDKQKTLQAILDGANLRYNVNDYDLTQPEPMDEQGSGGLWDLAGDIAYELAATKNNAETDLQTLLYNLMSDFRHADETDDNE